MRAYERLLKYVVVHTASDEFSETTPTTKRQFDLANLLVPELKELGIEDARVSDLCCVYGTLPATPGYENAPAIGLIAHLDTVPDFCGENVKPRVIENYDGEAVVLGESGRTLIVTDGTTVLGADDKAGIAIIMSLVEELVKHPNIKHGQISIAFTPDEEIGRGTDNFDITEFDADYAYTIDGGEIDLIEYENFNAASADVEIYGKSIHPGSAKGKMINSILVAEEFNDLLPSDMIPSKTEGYQGFNHLHNIKGDCEHTSMQYIIRNHSKELFEKQKKDFEIARDILNHKYEYEIVTLSITDSYQNMRPYIEKDPRSLNRIVETYNKLNIPFKFSPIRGGTDGATLTVKGLPTPNLGTGGYNYHGKFEYVSLTQMEKMVKILLELVK